MEIAVLEGSPNKNGSSNLLAAEFIRGAKESRHNVQVVDAAHGDIHSCTGCIHCGYEGPCVQKDDVNQIRQIILESDMIVFVTPLYYYGMSAQLKTLIDRFCAFNGSIQRKRTKSALLSVAWNDDNWTFEALETHYKTLVRYLNLIDVGMVLGTRCGTPAMTQQSQFPKLAYELGRSLPQNFFNKQKIFQVVDTKGTLFWKHDSEYDKPHILLLSKQVSREHLAYLDEKNISHIVSGDERIDLTAACKVLKETFGIDRMGVMGGSAINTSFLDAGFLNEVIVLIGAGIDGRASFPPVFNRTDNGDSKPTPLTLVEAKTYDSGAVFIRYKIK